MCLWNVKNVTSFENSLRRCNRFSQDEVKLDVTGVLIRTREDTEMRVGGTGGCVKTKVAEAGVVHPQAKGHRGWPASTGSDEEGRRSHSPEPLERPRLFWNLHFRLQSSGLQTLGRRRFCGLSRSVRCWRLRGALVAQDPSLRPCRP